MKMTQEHYQHIEAKIQEFIEANPEVVDIYETGRFNRAEAVKDLQTRFNFDMFNFAVPSIWVCDNLYSYLNDTHIRTALKRICPTVTRKY